jgi:hypothetical protein
VLRRWVDSFLAAPSEAARDEAVAALRELAGASPSAFLFAQMLLTRLTSEPGGAPLRRLAQELHAAAEARRGAAALRPFPALLAQAVDAPAAAAAADLCAAVGRMSSRGGGADATGRPGALDAAARLAALYFPQPAAPSDGPSGMDVDGAPAGGTAASAGPSREPLRAPATLRALLRLAFSPGFGTASPRPPPPPPPAGGASPPLPPAFELLVAACASAKYPPRE